MTQGNLVTDTYELGSSLYEGTSRSEALFIENGWCAFCGLAEEIGNILLSKAKLDHLIAPQEMEQLDHMFKLLDDHFDELEPHFSHISVEYIPLEEPEHLQQHESDITWSEQ